MGTMAAAALHRRWIFHNSCWDSIPRLRPFARLKRIRRRVARNLRKRRRSPGRASIAIRAGFWRGRVLGLWRCAGGSRRLQFSQAYFQTVEFLLLVGDLLLDRV